MDSYRLYALALNYLDLFFGLHITLVDQKHLCGLHYVDGLQSRCVRILISYQYIIIQRLHTGINYHTTVVVMVNIGTVPSILGGRRLSFLGGSKTNRLFLIKVASKLSRRKHEAMPIKPRPMVSRAQELQTAKEILTVVFGAQPGEMEEILQRRLKERSRHERGGGWIDFNSCRTLAINRLPT